MDESGVSWEPNLLLDEPSNLQLYALPETNFNMNIFRPKKVGVWKTNMFLFRWVFLGCYITNPNDGLLRGNPCKLPYICIKFDRYHLITPSFRPVEKKHGINHLQTVKLFKTKVPKIPSMTYHHLPLKKSTIHVGKSSDSSPMDPMGKGEILYLVDFLW